MVILFGWREADENITLGMFESYEAAAKAVHLKEVPPGFLYSILTPEPGEMKLIWNDKLELA